jgi:hypothetical protein
MNNGAALVGPAGSETATLIAKHEYESLASLLEILRGEQYDTLTLVVQQVVAVASHGSKPSFEAFAAFLLEHLEQRERFDDMVQATVVARSHKTETRVYTEADADLLLDLVALIHRGGWLVEWLRAQIPAAADANNPYPTPARVMESLTPELEKFDSAVETTREMLELHPSLFPQFAEASQ